MTTKTMITLGLGFLLALACGNLSAQTSSTGSSSSSETQAVLNSAVNNPNVLVVTGKIINAETGKPIKYSDLNFNKFGDEVLSASVDENGNYALAINKKEIGTPVRLVFRIPGYKKYIAKT